MKPLPALLLLAFAMAGGAFTHHLTENTHESSRGFRSIGSAVRSEPKRSRLPKGIAQLADKLISAAQGTAGPVNWILLDDTLASLTADQFPPLCRELTRRGTLANDYGTLEEALIEYWAATDAEGLLTCAAQPELGFNLKDVVAACYLHKPDAVIDAIRRSEASGNNEAEELWLMALYSLPSDAAALAVMARHDVFTERNVPDWIVTKMRRWAGKDPAAAVALAEQHPALLQHALEGWVGTDPDAAVAWMGQRPGKMLPPESLEFAVRQFARGHPAEAGRFIDQVEDKQEFYKAQAEGMAALPVSESAAWIKTLPSNERTAAYIVLTELLTNRDPAAAASFCSQLPELAPDLSTDHVVVAWAARDPAAAMEYLQTGKLPATVRARRAADVLRNWLVVDRAAALDFLERQPASEAKGQALLKASRILTDGDPESARDYALGLPENSLRVGACREILNTQLRQLNANPNEARVQAGKWIAAIPDAAIRKEMEAELAGRLPQAPNQ